MLARWWVPRSLLRTAAFSWNARRAGFANFSAGAAHHAILAPMHVTLLSPYHGGSHQAWAEGLQRASRHEIFGIAVCEAMYGGACAILPGRLNYPDLIPPSLHDRCLYSGPEALVARLCWALDHPRKARAVGEELHRTAARNDWSRLAGDYDALFEDAAR
jgi:glycosyltransferase involved in cell wall biosynthesis